MNADRSRRRIPATTFLITATLIGFGIEIATGAWNDGRALAELGAVAGYYIHVEHEYWRLLTAMFLHGNGTIPIAIAHVTANLYSLFQVGELFEERFGARRLLFVYFVSGITASWTSAMFTSGPSVGASGAIFGIVGAFIVTVRRSPALRRDHIERRIVEQLVFGVLAMTALALQFPFIDMAAHIGGFVAGGMIAAVSPRYVPPPSPPSQAIVDVTPFDE